MKRRRVVLVVMVLIVLAAAIASLLDPAARVQGWVGGEPFFEGRSATAWRRDLRRPDSPQSADAFSALVAGKADAVPVCAWVLRTATEPEARCRAAEALGRIGEDAAPAGPELIAALADPDPLVRRVAARAVGDLAPNVPGGVAALVGLFPEIDAIRAVSRFGPAGREAVPALAKLLRHDDSTVRWQATRTLGKIGEPSVPAIGELVRLTGTDPEPLVREHAAEALGDIGPAAAAGIPALMRALGDPVARVRRDAVRALGQLGPAAIGALAAVRTATGDMDPEVRSAAVRAVRLIDPAASTNE